MNDEILQATQFQDPFPHLIVDNFYNEEELELIWEELKFYTKPGKLLDVKDYGGVEGYTSAKAIMLDSLISGIILKVVDLTGEVMSNILTVNRKLFTSGVLDAICRYR